MNESNESPPPSPVFPSTLSDEEITRRLDARKSAWDDEPRVEPSAEQLAATPSPFAPEDGKLHPKKGAPDWAYAFHVGQVLNLNGWVVRVAGHYVDDVSEEPIGFVLIPQERTAAYVKRLKREARNEEIEKRRRGMKAVKK